MADLPNPNGPASPNGGGSPGPDGLGGPARNNGKRDANAAPEAWDANSSPFPSGDPPPLDDPRDPLLRGLGPAGGKSPTQVNTRTLKQFAENLRTLAEPLKTTQDELAAVAVRPGTFPTAMKMRKAVNAPEGDSALAKTLSASTANLYNGMMELSDALLRIANKYDSAEELNKLGLADYREAVNIANGYLGKLNTGSTG